MVFYAANAMVAKSDIFFIKMHADFLNKVHTLYGCVWLCMKMYGKNRWSGLWFVMHLYAIGSFNSYYIHTTHTWNSACTPHHNKNYYIKYYRYIYILLYCAIGLYLHRLLSCVVPYEIGGTLCYQLNRWTKQFAFRRNVGTIPLSSSP